MLPVPDNILELEDTPYQAYIAMSLASNALLCASGVVRIIFAIKKSAGNSSLPPYLPLTSALSLPLLTLGCTTLHIIALYNKWRLSRRQLYQIQTLLLTVITGSESLLLWHGNYTLSGAAYLLYCVLHFANMVV